METAIKKAIEGGYRKGHIWGVENNIYILQNEKGDRYGTLFVEQILLDPLFWQALGKAEGWGVEPSGSTWQGEEQWKIYWHSFIDHHAEGKDIDSFFKDLLRSDKVKSNIILFSRNKYEN